MNFHTKSCDDGRRDFVRLGARAVGAALCWSPLPLHATETAAESAAFHVAQSGETLSLIAAMHGLPVAELKLLNALLDDDISVGRRLRLRSEWRHLQPETVLMPNVNRQRWKHLIVHHSATRKGNAGIFDRYHREKNRMENGLAYHFVIGNGSDSGDGQIETGPRWKRQIQGGHVASLALNENSIGVCLVGNFEQQHPTRSQFEALVELLGYLKGDLLNDQPALLLHREVKGEHTLCPGRNFPGQRMMARLG